MYKKILSFCLLIITVFIFAGCSANDRDKQDLGDNNQQENVASNVAERKIIYTVSADINTDNLDNTLKIIKDNLNPNEWIDEETIRDNYARIIVRIKSDRLDAFSDDISSGGEFNNFERKTTDISVTYHNKQNLIVSLNAEMERLIELKAHASISELIEINSRITEIDYELMLLNEELNKYDSLIDYSKVTLSIYGKKHHKTLPFGKRLLNSFLGGVNALLKFIEFIVFAAAAIIPFAVIIVPTIFGIKYLHNKRKQKKIEKFNKLINK